MSRKAFVFIGMFLGSGIGAYLPLVWGESLLSLSSVLLSGIGGLVGIYAGYKIANYFGL